MSRRLASTFALGASIALVLSLPAVGSAQTASLTADTPYPGISVDPGRNATFTIHLTSDVTRTVDLSVTGLPDGWTATYKGGGSVITSATVGPDETPDVRLDVSVPSGSENGTHDLTAVITGGGASVSVPLTVTVQGGASGTVTLTPTFSGLRGSATANYSFDITAQNDTASDVTLELSASGPSGWRVDAKPTIESQASSLTVKSGSTGRITVSATPPVDVDSGTYDLTVTATGDGISVDTPLQVQIIGDYSMSVTTPDQRLNTQVTAGKTTQLPLVVVNTGTAPLVGVSLTGTMPSDWKIQFQPAVIDQLAPGAVADVTAVITPSTDAIAGDYDLALRGKTQETQSSVDIRATVSPSALWGLVGVGVIALTFAGLALVFRRFGRR